MPAIVAIESCIGSGKGFLLKYVMQHGLSNFARTHVLLQDDSIDQVLDYNKDPTRWAFTKEVHFLIRHVNDLHAAMQSRGHGLFLIEGSPVSDKHCFVEVSRMSEMERGLYDEWYDFLRSHWRVDHHLCLATSPHACLDRIVNNPKREQAQVSLCELNAVIKAYDRVFQGCKRLSCPDHFEDNEPVLEVMKRRLESVLGELVKNT
jgi:deoxyadenosine/deoxycytidine kinase